MQRGGGSCGVVAAVRGRQPWPQVDVGAGGGRRKQPRRDGHRGAERPHQHGAPEDRWVGGRIGRWPVDPCWGEMGWPRLQSGVGLSAVGRSGWATQVHSGTSRHVGRPAWGARPHRRGLQLCAGPGRSGPCLAGQRRHPLQGAGALHGGADGGRVWEPRPGRHLPLLQPQCPSVHLQEQSQRRAGSARPLLCAGSYSPARASVLRGGRASGLDRPPSRRVTPRAGSSRRLGTGPAAVAGAVLGRP